MIRCAIIVLACWMVVPRAAVADDKDTDPVRERLFAAKVAYDKEMAEFRKATEEWFDRRESAARKAGDKKLVDQIKADRKSFDENGELPKTAPAALRQKPVFARKALEAAYAEAIKAYTRAKKDDEAAAAEAEWQTFARRDKIDLLALVNPKEHAVAGEWKKDGEALVGKGGAKNALLQFPYEPGEEYDIEVTVRRVEGTDSFCVGLVAGGRQVRAVFDGWPPHYACGLDVLDKKRAFDNVTTVKGELLTAGRDHTLICFVRKEKIDLSVNGKVVTSFKGDFDRISLATLSRVPNEKALFLFIPSGTVFRLDRIMVTPVKGKGTILK